MFQEVTRIINCLSHSQVKMSPVKRYHAAFISQLLAYVPTSVVLFYHQWVKLASSSAQRGQRLTWGLRLGRNHRQPFRGGRKRTCDLRIPLKLLPANCQSTQIQSVSHSARCIDRKLCQSKKRAPSLIISPSFLISLQIFPPPVSQSCCYHHAFISSYSYPCCVV